MATTDEPVNESSHLLPRNKRLGSVFQNGDAESIISSHVSRDEQLLRDTAVGERLPYNDYTTIDWLHDLVRRNDSCTRRNTDKRKTGQRLVPLPIYPRAQRSPLQLLIGMGFVPRMVRSSPYRHVDRMRCLPRRHRSRDHQRLEDRLLQ